jgi:hypothetical protein
MTFISFQLKQPKSAIFPKDFIWFQPFWPVFLNFSLVVHVAARTTYEIFLNFKFYCNETTYRPLILEYFLGILVYFISLYINDDVN